MKVSEKAWSYVSKQASNEGTKEERIKTSKYRRKQAYEQASKKNQVNKKVREKRNQVSR